MALNKILLAVDDSKYSEKAAMLVLDLAQNDKLDVIIIHVCNDIPSAISDPDNRQQFGEGIGQEAFRIVTFYREIMSRLGIKSSIRLTPGDVAEEIVKCAEGENCDLIAMGAKGRSGLAGVFMGNITEKVIRQSSLPLLLAR